MIKKYLLIITILIISCKAKKTEKANPDYFFTSGKFNYEPSQKWTEIDNETASFSFGFIKGDCCGSVPNPQIMKSKIIGDTIFYTSGKNYVENCERNFGMCGSNPMFVINIKKYPNYQKLKWKLVSESYFKK